MIEKLARNIIFQAIRDLRSDDPYDTEEILSYLESERFEQDCAVAGYPHLELQEALFSMAGRSKLQRSVICKEVLDALRDFG